MEAANKESPFEERGRTNQELVGLLISRGLGGEPSDILRALETVGYFRLKGYLFPLLKKGATDKSFAEGATIGRACRVALAVRQKSRRLRNVCERHPSRREPRLLSRCHLLSTV